MRFMSPRQRAAGFTMVELLVTVGIFALLAAIAVPTLRTVSKNNRIRASSMSLQNGLALARAEAVRLNTRVAFRITGTGWDIQLADGTLLHQASGRERSAGLSITAKLPAVSTIVFDAYGRKTAGATQIDIEATDAAGSKPLRIQLPASGQARLCDPAVASTEPKACL
jgi:type IV fimbrial biogenesis protein FimT